MAHEGDVGPDTFRPRATGLITMAWAAQSVIAILWIVSSLVDGASMWVWPFGVSWAGVGVLMALRARRQWVACDEHGITVQSGFSPRWSWAWGNIVNVTPEPPGPLVTHLAVVGHDGRVAQTPLAKGDERLREVWHDRSQHGSSDAHPTPV